MAQEPKITGQQSSGSTLPDGRFTRVGSATAFGVRERFPEGLAAIGNTLYMVGEQNDALYSINKDTGVGMRIGNAFAFGVFERSPSGLAAIGNTLYMVGSANNALFTLDITTGVATRVGSANNFGVSEGTPRGLAAIGNTLYMVGGSNEALYSINKDTGVGMRIGNANDFGVRESIPRGLAAIGTTLYMVGDSNNALYTIDTTTGIGTRVNSVNAFGVGETSPRGLAAIGNTLYMVGERHEALYVSTSPTPTPVPTNVTATTRADSIFFSWDSVAGADRYEWRITNGVNRSDTHNPTAGARQSQIVHNFPVGITYMVSVRARVGGVWSDYSTPVSVVVRIALTAIADDEDSITISWDAVSGISSYEYRFGTVSGTYGNWVDTGSTATSISVGSLNANTQYFFQVRPVFPFHSGEVSNEASATTSATKPSAPTNLVATAGVTSIRLSWDAVSGITGYSIRLKTDGDYGRWRPLSGTRTFTDVALDNNLDFLETGVEYTFQVRADNNSVSSDPSNEASATPAAPLSAPTNLTATAGIESVSLAWDAISGITSYQYRFKTDGNYGDWVDTSSTANSVEVDSLTAGTLYTFQVRSVNNSRFSSESNEATATPTAAPTSITAPTNLTATARVGGVSLSWDAVSLATSYQYRIKTTGAYSGWSNAGTGTFFVVQPLDADVAATFQVRARNDTFSLISDPSNEASATPTAPQPEPYVPQNPMAVAQSRNNVFLYWSPVSQSRIRSYEYRFKTNAGYGNWINTRRAFPEQVVASLSAGTRYIFQIRSKYLDPSDRDSLRQITSNPSAEITATPASSAPDTPSNFSTTPLNNGNIRLDWDAVSGVAGYRYNYWVNDSPVEIYSGWIDAGSGTSEIVSGLTDGVSYRFRIVSVDSAGTFSNFSSTVRETSRVIPDAPDAPTITATAQESPLGSVKVVITAVDNATGYDYRYMQGSNAFTEWDDTGVDLSPANPEVVISGLAKGVIHTFEARAKNAGGNSDPSNQATATPLGLPDGPVITSVDEGDGQLTITWTAPSNTGGRPITSYSIDSADLSDIFDPKDIRHVDALPTARSHTFTGLTNDVEYTLVIAAVTSLGRSTPITETGTPSAATIAAMFTDFTGVKSGNFSIGIDFTGTDLVSGFDASDLGITFVSGDTISDAGLADFTITRVLNSQRQNTNQFLINFTPAADRKGVFSIDVIGEVIVNSARATVLVSAVEVNYDNITPIMASWENIAGIKIRDFAVDLVFSRVVSGVDKTDINLISVSGDTVATMGLADYTIADMGSGNWRFTFTPETDVSGIFDIDFTGTVIETVSGSQITRNVSVARARINVNSSSTIEPEAAQEVSIGPPERPLGRVALIPLTDTVTFDITWREDFEGFNESHISIYESNQGPVNPLGTLLNNVGTSGTFTHYRLSYTPPPNSRGFVVVEVAENISEDNLPFATPQIAYDTRNIQTPVNVISWDMPDGVVMDAMFECSVLLSRALVAPEILLVSDIGIDGIEGAEVESVEVDENNDRQYNITVSIPQRAQGNLTLTIIGM